MHLLLALTHDHLVKLLASEVLLNMSESIPLPSMTLINSHQRGTEEEDVHQSIPRVSGTESVGDSLLLLMHSTLRYTIA